ncbi:hypothetical protein [Shewanella sp. NKUCC06_TVS]|uniref:hypothetical protein n=1 Tax=Shewanella sp. NKUCC06_TVS TaxID=2842128 RepID=UPI001C5AC879|nr:hypothetical protein [Shewanella sp. NKUCC06_TVS]MBW3530697.1 hypothetical protein [Shewanella sp. NKUCC06_TVS]
MKTQIKKPKGNSSKAVSNLVSQKTSNVKQHIGLVDNRPEAIAQRKLQKLMGNSDHVKPIAQLQPATDMTGIQLKYNNGIIQRVTSVNVTNTSNNYDSGWLQAETQSTGVDAGPRAEAQAVAGIAGGTWVGGHMVNDRLGGGGGFDNIHPITAAMNNQHHTIENAAQNKVGNGGTAYEVRYYMNILHRDDYTFTPSGDTVNNLADKFQQHYDYRTKEVPAGGTSSRPVLYQAASPITRVDGKVLQWT